MSFRATTLRRQFLGFSWLGLLALAALPVMAQEQGAQPPAPIVFPHEDAVTSTLVTANNNSNSSSGGGSGEAAQWLKVEFHYSVNPPPPANPSPGSNPQAGGYLGEVKFKVWIEGRDMQDPLGKPGEGIAIALTGSVTYINLAAARDAYGVFYVHPSTLAIFSNPRDGVRGFEHKYDVHVEAEVDGKAVAEANEQHETDPKWYLPPAVRAVPGLVYRQNQSPFVNTDPDRYPAIKLPESADQ